MRRIVPLAAAVSLVAAAPMAWAQDVRPLSPGQTAAPSAEAAKPAPEAAPAAAEDASAHARAGGPLSAQPGDTAPPPAPPPAAPPNPDPDRKGILPPDADAQAAAQAAAKKPPPKKTDLAEAGGATVGGLLASAAGTAAGGPLGGAAAGLVGNMVGGGLVRGVKKVFGIGRKKDAAPAQAAQTTPGPG